MFAQGRFVVLYSLYKISLPPPCYFKSPSLPSKPLSLRPLSVFKQSISSLGYNYGRSRPSSSQRFCASSSQTVQPTRVQAGLQCYPLLVYQALFAGMLLTCLTGLIFDGAFLGFILAKFEYLNIWGVFCNSGNPGFSAAPGECFWYQNFTRNQVGQ